MFYGDLHQVRARNVSLYTPSTDAKIALGVSSTNQLMRGITDQEMSMVEFDPPPSPSPTQTFRQILPEPEADRLLFSFWDYSVEITRISEYAVEADGKARMARSSDIPMPAGPAFSRPSHGPDRRLIYREFAVTGELLVELANSGAGWTEVNRYLLNDLKGESSSFELDEASLSADGLRFVVIAGYTGMVSTTAAFYSDRATLSDRFTPLRLIANAPYAIQAPYLTEDCGRLYFSALGTVFYLE